MRLEDGFATSLQTKHTLILAFFQEVHAELRKSEVSVDKLGFQLTNIIITQTVEQLRSEI